MNTEKTRRGSCPRCNGRTIQHYVAGMPNFDAYTDDDGNMPDWIHLTGCVILPGPSSDRSCDNCGLRWNSWLKPRLVFSTWRELREHLEVDSNGAANDWVRRMIGVRTLISTFPEVDDPDGTIAVQNGDVSRSFHFPFMHAEWESELLEVYDAVLKRDGAFLGWM